LVGDLIIIATYAAVSEEELAGYRPTILLLDARNTIKDHLQR
jgi:aspartate 1-decarboxylase